MDTESKSQVKEGYIVFSLDSDEITGTLVDEQCYNSLMKDGTIDEAVDVFYEWFENNINAPRYHIQTWTSEPWPFNGFVIKGTFCLLSM